MTNPILTDLSEAERLALLRSYPLDLQQVTDQLDRLAKLAAQICHTPVALVSIVESDRQVFIGRSGTELEETPRAWSFCTYAMHESQTMTVSDATQDTRFSDNPLVTGAPGIRFYAGEPLRSREGAALGSFCVIDTSPRDALSEDQESALETLGIAAMAVLEKARTERDSASLQHSAQIEIGYLEQRFQLLADAMPQLVWSTDADGVSDYFNRLWEDYTGIAAEECYGTGWLSCLHPEDRDRAALHWRDAVNADRDYDLEYRVRRHDGVYRWMLVRGMPMRGPDGEITRWIGTCTDIQEQKEAAERLDVISRELNHRIKNIFAVIGGLINLTMRKYPAGRDICTDLQKRVLALGRAHDLVRTHSAMGGATPPHSTLREVLDAILKPYEDDAGTRIIVDEDARIDIDDRAATPLALYFHELATNAAKYGALSTPDGTVTITLQADPETGNAILTWQEDGGPRVKPDAEKGFGATLVDMSICRQLGGTLDYDWRPAGLCVHATIPLNLLIR